MDKFELLAHFSALPTGNIADACAKLGVSCRIVTGLHPVAAGLKRAAGYAVTIKQMIRSVDAEESVLTRHADVIDNHLGKGELLVVDVGGKDSPCTGGALLALRAQTSGAAGFLINGCMRDIEEIAALKFPVLLKGGCPIKSSPSLETVGINIPVEINDTQIVPGDLIVMDETGVIVVPAKHAEAVCKEAERIFALEEKVEKLVRQGHGVIESLAIAAKN